MTSGLISLEDMVMMLENDCKPLEHIVTGLILKKKTTVVEDIRKAEQILGVKFDPDFEKLVSAYDFGDFSISGVHFGSGDDYLAKLRDLHMHVSEENLLTFADEYICIATGDYYSRILQSKILGSTV